MRAQQRTHPLHSAQGGQLTVTADKQELWDSSRAKGTLTRKPAFQGHWAALSGTGQRVPRDTVWPGRGVMTGVRHQATFMASSCSCTLDLADHSAPVHRLTSRAATEAQEGTVRFKYLSPPSGWGRSACNNPDNISLIFSL